MLSVDDALQKVIERCSARPAVRRQLDDALGCVLAEDVASDVDSPPHDKSVVQRLRDRGERSGVWPNGIGSYRRSDRRHVAHPGDRERQGNSHHDGGADSDWR